MCAISARFVTCAAAVAAASASFTLAGVADYGAPYREFNLPPVGQDSFGVASGALADGRLVAATGDSIFVETGVGTGDFTLGATIDSSLIGGAVDPSFLEVSPDGSRIALGAGFNKPVLVFDASDATAGGGIDATNADAFDVSHFSAGWRSDSELAITFGAFGAPSQVSLLDVTSDPASPVNPVIIDNIGGASAGVAFDSEGRLYTGNGFDNGPGGSETGWIKAFEPSDWQGGAADFESGGTFIADILSAGSLVFDEAGNLFVGGADGAAGDAGYLGALDADAIASVLAGAGPIDLNDPSVLARLDPRGDASAFYSAGYNDLTGEAYVIDGATVYATIPAPGASIALAGGLLMAGRRRRDA